MNGNRNDGSVHRLARLGALASLLVGALAIGAAPVAAAAPTVQEFDVEVSGPADWLDCGFPVFETGRQHLTLTTYYNADGSFRENTLRDRSTWTETNVATGKVATESDVRNYFNAFSGTPTVTGSVTRISIRGVVLHDSGLLTWTFDDGTIIRMAGPHPTFADGIDWCGLLAS
jgi:hypothetical protein